MSMFPFSLTTNKYKAKKTRRNGIAFDSAAEAQMYTNLKFLEKAGEIKNLKVQPQFTLIHPFINANHQKIRPLTYRADFSFYDLKEKRERVIDCKGFRTEVYRIKKKLFDWKMRKKNLFLEETLET